MKYLQQAGISFITSVLILAAVYYFMPFEPLFLLDENDGMLGATITTINGSDKIKDSRAVINTNFANLNSDKIEVSTTTLPNITTLANLATVGTITTGTWNGTTLTVAKGGTGSTTLLTNGVLYGNGTNGVLAVPVGSNDQVLTLVGGVPTWTSTVINQTLNYDWTGETTLASTTFAASTTWNILPEYDSDPIGNDEAARKSYVDSNTHNVKVGSFSANPANGATTTITHGLGYIPREIEIRAVKSGTMGVTHTIGSHGFYDGSTYATIVTWTSDNPGQTIGVITSAIIAVSQTTSGSWNSGPVATISHLTDTTFQLNWTVATAQQALIAIWRVR
jgi:hypothetical protein